jgi:predicted transcriptional regulator
MPHSRWSAKKWAPGAITPAQVRRARALLGWSQIRLAQEAGVRPADIAVFEHRGGARYRLQIVFALSRANVQCEGRRVRRLKST